MWPVRGKEQGSHSEVEGPGTPGGAGSASSVCPSQEEAARWPAPRAGGMRWAGCREGSPLVCEPRRRLAAGLEGPQADSPRQEPLRSACSALASGTPPGPEPLMRPPLLVLTSFCLKVRQFLILKGPLFSRGTNALPAGVFTDGHLAFGGGGFRCRRHGFARVAASAARGGRPGPPHAATRFSGHLC